MTVAIRIGLRYVAGYLVFKGIIPTELADAIANDPEVAIAIGGALTLAVEGAYQLARRFGWAR